MRNNFFWHVVNSVDNGPMGGGGVFRLMACNSYETMEFYIDWLINHMTASELDRSTITIIDSVECEGF